VLLTTGNSCLGYRVIVNAQHCGALLISKGAAVSDMERFEARENPGSQALREARASYTSLTSYTRARGAWYPENSSARRLGFLQQ
jgi:hypothetical protein